MAHALGMNPKKLPGLRPSPQQRWKLPVGEFIEERYRKRFGCDPLDYHPHVPEPGSRKPSTPQRDAQAGDLVCYLMNLADDLQKWLARGTVAPQVLPQVIEELREFGGTRHWSADLADPGDSASAPPDAPRVVAATRSGAHVRRRDPVLIARSLPTPYCRATSLKGG
jgi:hypothetical protein